MTTPAAKASSPCGSQPRPPARCVSPSRCGCRRRGRLSQRWRTSVFVDETPRTFDLRLQDFEPADRPTARQPLVTPIDSLLFVIDTINARPESTGRVWLSDVALGVNRME